MELNNLKNKPHLSYSALNEYMTCGKKYELSRIKKYKPEFEPDVLIFGKAIHKVLADFNQERMIGNIMPIQDMHEKFELYWFGGAKDNAQIRYSKNKDFVAHLFEGKELLTVFYENFKQTEKNTILAIEEPFEFMIEGLSIPIIGVYDLVEQDEKGTIIISDYKTSGKAYSADDVDNSMQLSMYQIASNTILQSR
jgi:putative RecB family exonuclease